MKKCEWRTIIRNIKWLGLLRVTLDVLLNECEFLVTMDVFLFVVVVVAEKHAEEHFSEAVLEAVAVEAVHWICVSFVVVVVAVVVVVDIQEELVPAAVIRCDKGRRKGAKGAEKSWWCLQRLWGVNGSHIFHYRRIVSPHVCGHRVVLFEGKRRRYETPSPKQTLATETTVTYLAKTGAMVTVRVGNAVKSGCGKRLSCYTFSGLVWWYFIS